MSSESAITSLYEIFKLTREAQIEYLKGNGETDPKCLLPGCGRSLYPINRDPALPGILCQMHWVDRADTMQAAVNAASGPESLGSRHYIPAAKPMCLLQSLFRWTSTAKGQARELSEDIRTMVVQRHVERSTSDNDPLSMMIDVVHQTRLILQGSMSGWASAVGKRGKARLVPGESDLPIRESVERVDALLEQWESEARLLRAEKPAASRGDDPSETSYWTLEEIETQVSWERESAIVAAQHGFDVGEITGVKTLEAYDRLKAAVGVLETEGDHQTAQQLGECLSIPIFKTGQDGVHDLVLTLSSYFDALRSSGSQSQMIHKFAEEWTSLAIEKVFDEGPKHLEKAGRNDSAMNLNNQPS